MKFQPLETETIEKGERGKEDSKGKRKEGVRNDKCKRIKPGKVLERVVGWFTLLVRVLTKGSLSKRNQHSALGISGKNTSG